jgi:hypothetical protein
MTNITFYGQFVSPKRISNGAQYVTLNSKIKSLRFSCLFFANPTNKTETAYTRGTTIANHLDQSLWLTIYKYWASVRSNLLHSFLEVHNCAATFTNHNKLHEIGVEKPISWAKLAHFAFLQ